MQRIGLFGLNMGPVVEGRVKQVITRSFWDAGANYLKERVLAGPPGEFTIRCAKSGIYFPASRITVNGKGQTVGDKFKTDLPVWRF